MPRVPSDWLRVWAGEGDLAALIGSLRDSTTSAPIRSAVVRLLPPTSNSSGAVIATAESGKRGSFVLARISPGRYLVEARALGYEPTRFHVVFTRGQLDTLEIRMKRGVVPLGRSSAR